MKLNKQEDKPFPLENERCGAVVNLPIGCFSNLPSDFSTFGDNALNTTQPRFSNKGYRCKPSLIWMDFSRSTFNHPSKHRFPNSEARHVTIISSM
jgi:hypothetical protein